jgi:hypothetical protein
MNALVTEQQIAMQQQMLMQQQGQGQGGQFYGGMPPPQPPKSPRWPLVLAAAAVLLVAGLVFALLIVSNASRESTVVAPLPQTTSSSAPRVPTTTRVPTRAPIPAPTEQPLPTAPSRPAPAQTSEPGAPIPPDETPAAPAVTENVMYTVSGEGRAINITYVDSGGVMQTEFNVALPWSKQVGLEAPAKDSASVAVVNVGRDVTCSVTVNGAQIRQRTGRGPGPPVRSRRLTTGSVPFNAAKLRARA